MLPKDVPNIIKDYQNDALVAELTYEACLCSLIPPKMK